MQQENERVYSPQFYADNKLKGVSGVYQIRNITNNKIYVGSANNLWRRKNKEHFKFLRENRHGNTYLQNAFNLDGEENFIFEIIDLCEEKYLLLVEQYWLDKFYDNQNMCYNINPIASKPPSWKGKRHTEESRQKIREKSSMFRHSDETKQKLSIMAKERFGSKSNHKKKVIRLIDNKIYDLMQDCAKDNNKSIYTIIRHCKNTIKKVPQEFMYYVDWIKQQKDES